MKPGEEIYELRRRAADLRRQANNLDAQAFSIAATEHARVERELRLELQAARAALGEAIERTIGVDGVSGIVPQIRRIT